MTHKRHILIIEDEPDVSDMLKKFFELRNFYVVVADNGLDALNYFKKAIPDLVITDLLLPGEHGVDVIRTIKEKYFVPVIIISGIYQHDDVKNLMDDYFVEGFFQKPVELEQLLERVNALVLNTLDAEPAL